MDFLIPGLIALACAAIAAVIVRRSGRAERAKSAPGPGGASADSGTRADAKSRPSKAPKPTVSQETAAEASAKLTMAQHRSVYSRIAEGQQLQAIAEYRRAAGATLRYATAAVASMANYPQPFQPADSTTEQPRTTPAGNQPKYRYRAIVSHGNEVREIASTELNDDIVADIRRQALAGDRDSAIRLLMDHSQASLDEAAEFVALIHDEDQG